MPGRVPYLWLCVALVVFGFAPPRTTVAADREDAVFSATEDHCGAEPHLEATLRRDPDLAARRALVEQIILEAQQNGLIPPKGASTNANPTYTIPTVVHIIHTGLNGDPENISDNQVKSQIFAVNRDLQNQLNYSTGLDTKIQLCLVNKDPNGNSSWAGAAGITRHLDGTATLAMDVLASETAMKAYGYFPSNRYLNVWVVKRITVGGGGGVLGFATFPGSVPANLDGIVMDYRVMGANNTGFGTFASLLPPLSEGKVFAHEVGHYLDLYHTFHLGCVGDQVNDTNPEATNFWGCPSGIPTTVCNNITYPAPFHNFMDYTDDACRWEFTSGQQVRMFAALGNPRAELVSAANLTAVGACPPTATALITPSTLQQCVGQPISFSAPPCSGTCTYTWTFQNGAGNTSVQNTSATFSQPGPQLVTLSVSDGSSTANTSISVFITACTPVSNPCTNWVFGRGVRLSFASGLATAVPGNYRNLGTEAASQVSGASGNLLFYTNNDTIWNVNNAPMALSGSNTQPLRGNSSHNGALVVARPGVNLSQITNQYYLLSIIQAESWGQSKPPFTLTTVDMNGSGGLGTITNTNAPVTMPQGTTAAPNKLMEAVTAIPQCNGFDWWAITAGCDSTNSNYDWQRYVYVTPITNGGAGTTQQFASGFAGPSPINGYSGWGAITPSPDGTKFAICQGEAHAVHIYDFDRASGTPTLSYNSGNIEANQDLEFSPDGRLIYYCYISGNSYVDNLTGTGYYGIRALDPGSGTIRTIIPATTLGLAYDLQRGPDGRIYIARPSVFFPPQSQQLQTSLDVINFPNTLNSTNTSNECGFVANAIPLAANTSTSASGSLPNTIPYCTPATLPPATFSWVENPCKNVTFKTPNCGPYTWNFGDGSNPVPTSSPTISHPYPNSSTQGTYTVTMTTNAANPTVATQQITIGPAPISIAGPGSACGGPLNYSVIGPSNLNYVWTVSGGSPATATGNNVFVSWGLGSSASITVTGTNPKTGCVSTATKLVDPCSNCTPAPPNMIAWWPLDEPLGTTAKDLVGAHDGSDVNAPTHVAGAVSMARHFGPTSHTIANHHPMLNLGTNNLSIDAWIRTTANPTYAGIVEKRLLGPNRGYALYLKDTQLALSLGDGTTSTEYVATNGPNLIDGFWHHVAATEDRNNTSAGTKLYIDGAAVNVFPAYGGGNIDNTENVVIGAREPSSAPVDHFTGDIDEVEIFSRALTGLEVAGIFGAGAGGKCKEYVYVPAAQTFCTNSPIGYVTVYVCNFTQQPQSYALSFAGTSGAGCTVAGPTSFTITSQNTNNVIGPVAPGYCQPETVKVVKPNGMGNGDVSCFSMTATNTASNISRVTNGSFTANESVCPILKSQVLTSVGVGVSVAHTFQLTNTSFVAQNVNVEVEAIGVDQPILVGGGTVSLNGQPPGFPWFTSYALAPGESTLVNVDAQFTELTPFVPYDILLSADIDGNGSPDAKVAAGMINSEAPLTNLGVPKERPPSTVDLIGAWPNPFHRLLTVELALPKAGAVQLELYDVGGRRVRRVVRENVAAGRGLRVLDAAGLPSGLYLLRVETEGMVRTRRIVLLGP